jgi:hypothetical protein
MANMGTWAATISQYAIGLSSRRMIVPPCTLIFIVPRARISRQTDTASKNKPNIAKGQGNYVLQSHLSWRLPSLEYIAAFSVVVGCGCPS